MQKSSQELCIEQRQKSDDKWARRKSRWAKWKAEQVKALERQRSWNVIARRTDNV